MKKIVLIIFALVLVISIVGCALHWSDKSQVLPKEVCKGIIEYDDRPYYIVKPLDFLDSPDGFWPFYQGSVDNYHLFYTRSWDDSDYRYAVSRENCIVEDEKSPEEEATITRQSGRLIYHRRVFIENGMIIVKKREVPGS